MWAKYHRVCRDDAEKNGGLYHRYITVYNMVVGTYRGEQVTLYVCLAGLGS